MRLRHKKNAENDILNYPICIKPVGAKLCEPVVGASSFYFSDNNPLHLELGMGKGRFIIEMANRNPQINYIGVEKSATIVLKAITLAGTGPTNLRFLCEDIFNLDKYFDLHTIDKIYLNFSDPWPKKRHESRRLTHNRFLSLYEKLLKKDGIIEFKTDNKDLFDFSIEEIKNSNFKILEYTYDLHNDEKMNANNIMTEYEEKFSKIGNKICKLIAKNSI